MQPIVLDRGPVIRNKIVAAALRHATKPHDAFTCCQHHVFLSTINSANSPAAVLLHCPLSFISKVAIPNSILLTTPRSCQKARNPGTARSTTSTIIPTSHGSRINTSPTLARTRHRTLPKVFSHVILQESCVFRKFFPHAEAAHYVSQCLDASACTSSNLDVNLSPEQLRKTEITGNKQVDAIQDGLAEGVGGQFGKGGLLGVVGEGVSDQGVTRAERGDTGPLSPEEAKKQQKGYLGGATDAASNAGSGVLNAGKSMGGWLGGGKQ